MKELLYIGLNGHAGSGKDTVAKMLKTVLNYFDSSLEECMDIYKKYYYNPWVSATFTKTDDTKKDVYCIAFADQLKTICSTIFGIPVNRFYENKETAWVCINKDFQYTEIKPDDSTIITAEEYYCGIENYKYGAAPVWMSLREILVYVGTYVLQSDINQRIFVNVVNNMINEQMAHNNSLKYVIVTDIRFSHEIEYLHKHAGITINIVRDEIKQLDNIAEHVFDNESEWDYIIENNGTYEELFEKVYNMVHENVEFSNITYELNSRENISNYIRLIECDKDNEGVEHRVFMVCAEYDVQSVAHTDGEISMINLVGGPMIFLNQEIDGECTDFKPQKIELDMMTGKFLLKD